MKKLLFLLLIAQAALAQTASFWLTNGNQKNLLDEQPTLSFKKKLTEDNTPTIYVDDTKRFQSIDGFGFTLTGGSASLLSQLNPKKRKEILEELFDPKKGIGVSTLRLSIGASDLSEDVFSYANEHDDETLIKFSLAEEQKDLLPILKEIVAIQPSIQFIGSPWSPPVWMKSNNSSIGGQLLQKYYNVYANYLAKYVEEMKKEGITIDAITIQNEPLHPGNNPSLLMYAYEQADFIKNHLGPLFKSKKLATKLIIYDHNADRPDYPIQVLSDPDAKKYIDGSAFHLYGGVIESLTSVHEAFPDKNLYFTEQWIGAPSNFEGDMVWHIKNIIIGSMRNWCKTALEWNLAADEKQNPHTKGGCTQCLGALTIDHQHIERNAAYYVIAHASKFARPGSVRIASNPTMSLANVAFRTKEGKIVLVVLNEGDKEQSFYIRWRNKEISTSLAPKSVATYVW